MLAGQLIMIAWIDMRKMIIPHALNLSLAVTGALVSVLLLQTSWWILALQAIIAFGVFSAVSLIYARWRGQQGLGGGDVKFLTAATLWVGLIGLPWVVLVASVSGLAFALVRHFLGQRIQSTERLAFGPHLALGLMATWLLRDEVLHFAN
jgi:leader peptidase (prepilin peptidase) / N-methyltransferase